MVVFTAFVLSDAIAML